MIRLRSLGLDAYGVFDGVRLPLGKGLTIVVGANEAGKSTALNALADLLWGLPLRHPLAELTPRSSIRLTAELEDPCSYDGPQEGYDGPQEGYDGPQEGYDGPQDGVRSVVTRTGRGLLTGEAREPATNPWGADGEDSRRSWMTAFGLSHSAMRVGGQEVCQGGGDLAELVFSAQHGRGVQGLLREIEQRADVLYKDHRNNRNVRLRVAVEEYRNRQQALDQALVRASHVVQAENDVRELGQRAEGAAKHEAQAMRAVTCLAEHLRCLDTVHAVHRLRRDIAVLRAEGVHLEGEDLADHDQARAMLKQAGQEEAQIIEQIRAWTAERESLTVDVKVLADAVLVDDLHAQAQARLGDRERVDDLRYRADSRACDARNDLVAVLGHDDSRDTGALLEALAVPADRAAQLEALAERHPGLLSDRKRHADRVEEDQAALALLDFGSNPPDMKALAPLAEIVRTLTADASAPARLRAARGEQIEAARCRRQAMLAAGAQDPDVMPPTPPGEGDIASAARRVDEARSVAGRAGERQQEAEAALDSRRQRLRDLENARTVQPGTLEEARRRRDDLWAKINAVWSDSTAVTDPDPQALAATFVEQIRATDDITDQLILQAQVDGELTHVMHEVNRAERLLQERVLAREEAIAARDRELSDWQASWATVGVAAPSTAQAETVRRALLAAAGAAIDEAAARETAVSVESEVTEWTVRLRSMLGAFVSAAPSRIAEAAPDKLEATPDKLEATPDKLEATPDKLEATPDKLAVLEDLLASARSLLDDADRAREQQERRRTALKTLERSQTRLARSDEALADWTACWTTLLHAVGLPELLDPVGWTERRSHLRAARTAYDEVTALEQEASVSLRAWEAFHADATGLGARHGLSGSAESGSAERIVEELWQRLATSRTDQRTHQERTEAIAGASRRQSELSGIRSTAQARLDSSCQRYGLPDHDALSAAADRGQRIAHYQETEGRLLERLHTAIDPERDIEDVVIQLAGTDQADLEIRAQQAEKEHASAQESRAEVFQQLGAAKKTLAELQRRGDSAELNARVQEALAAIAEFAEEYAELHLKRVLLREALEADATKHASPLLLTAGRVLERLTGGRWVALRAEDNGDRIRRVHIIRHDGDCKPLNSLSEGTADQVFLALRLAGIAHRQNERRKTAENFVPIVLDDVLMAFDDRRTGNALRALADVAAGTETDSQAMQILLFTHHQHLADLAEALERDDVLTVHLESQPLPDERIDPDKLRQAMASFT